MTWLADSLVVSALLRSVVVYVCAQAYVLLSPRQTNYWNAPWFVRPAVALFGAVSTANIADLFARALTVHPNRVLLTGYALSVSEGVLALALYLWLLMSWRPVGIQQQRQRRSDNWAFRGGLWPCVRRKRMIRERLKRSAAGSQAAGHINRALKSEHPPIMEDMDHVIPPALRGR